MISCDVIKAKEVLKFAKKKMTVNRDIFNRLKLETFLHLLDSSEFDSPPGKGSNFSAICDLAVELL